MACPPIRAWGAPIDWSIRTTGSTFIRLCAGRRATTQPPCRLDSRHGGLPIDVVGVHVGCEPFFAEALGQANALVWRHRHEPVYTAAIDGTRTSAVHDMSIREAGLRLFAGRAAARRMRCRTTLFRRCATGAGTPSGRAFQRRLEDSAHPPEVVGRERAATNTLEERKRLDWDVYGTSMS